MEPSIAEQVAPIMVDWMKTVLDGKPPEWHKDIMNMSTAEAALAADTIGIRSGNYLLFSGVDSKLISGANGQLRTAYFMAAKSVPAPMEHVLALLKVYFGLDLKQEIAHWYEYESYKSITLEQFLRKRGMSDQEQRLAGKMIHDIHYRLMGISVSSKS